MPAQSGHSDTQARMRRGYSREAYSQLVRHIKATVPNVGISSDFISGFCVETQAEHAATVDLLREVRRMMRAYDASIDASCHHPACSATVCTQPPPPRRSVTQTHARWQINTVATGSADVMMLRALLLLILKWTPTAPQRL
jgi:hypothetical protein